MPTAALISCQGTSFSADLFALLFMVLLFQNELV